MKIIDIHTHMLYGLDDGARDLSMSMQLIGMDYEQGVRGIFLTSHAEGVVGTDTHRLDYKSPEAKIGADTIIEKYGEEYAKKALYENAQRILIGEK